MNEWFCVKTVRCSKAPSHSHIATATSKETDETRLGKATI